MFFKQELTDKFISFVKKNSKSNITGHVRWIREEYGNSLDMTSIFSTIEIKTKKNALKRQLKLAGHLIFCRNTANVQNVWEHWTFVWHKIQRFRKLSSELT